MSSIPLQLTLLADISLLKGLEYYPETFSSHTHVAQELPDKHPRLITVIIDHIKPDHFYKNKYGKTSYTERPTLDLMRNKEMPVILMKMSIS